MKKITLGALIAMLLAGGSVAGYKIVRDTKADAFENSVHQVVYVADGDTVDVENKVRIRLLGINAPERGDCHYAESRDYLKTLLGDAHVRIEKDITGADRYGRLLRYMYIVADTPSEDDVFVNEALVRQGHAKVLAVAPDNRYRDLLASAQEDAKLNGRGLWSECAQEESPSLREVDAGPENPTCTIKGNISEKAYGRNYFLEGCPNYNRIKIDTRKGESYFCTEQEAEDAGFSRSASCANTF